MLLQIVSDIHLEFGKRTIPVVGDSIALLGDIGKPYSREYCDFIEFCCEHFDKVYIIPGNHEYWSSKHTMTDIDDKIKSFESDKVIYLNNRHVFVTSNSGKSYCIFGSTLWSDIPDRYKYVATQQLNDFLHIICSKTTGKYKDTTCIQKLTVPIFNELHSESVKSLQTAITATTESKNLVILTHYAPTIRTTGQYYRTEYNIGFYGELYDLIKSLPDDTIWAHGHTHQFVDTYVNTTRIVSNPVGYRGELTGYTPGFCVELM